MSRREWRSLLVLFTLAVAGHLLRAAFVSPGQAPGALTLFDPHTDGDPQAQKRAVQQLMRPLGSTERIDIETATANELRRVPGLGPAMAARIVADRETHGAFGGMGGLSRVAGMGAATQAKLAPHLQFSGVPADISKTGTDSVLVDLNQASVPELDALPGIGLVRARAMVAFRDSAGPFRQIEDLLKLPGFTRSLVSRIGPRVVVR